MNWFINVSTRSKLAIGFGVLWFLLAVIILFASMNIYSVNTSYKHLGDIHYETALQLADLRSHMNYNRGMMLRMILFTDLEKQKECETKINEKSEEIDNIIKNLKNINIQDSEFLSQLEGLNKEIVLYAEGRKKEISLVYENKIEEAKDFGSSSQDDLYRDIRRLSSEMIEQSNKEVLDTSEIIENNASKSIKIFIIVGLISLFFVGILTIYLDRLIAKPLSQLTDAAEDIAKGNLNIILSSNDNREDEIGFLTKTFSHMIDSLRKMANIAERIATNDLRGEFKAQSEEDILGKSFAKMVENLRNSTTNISDAVNTLGSSASEILTATTQVASSTTETAAAISETTTTVEEVRQAADMSSKKAKNVSDSAQQVSAIAKSGQKSVDETSDEMRNIKNQMESIAETIVKLSEQSQSIGGIIATVTDLADQSNLLAVNAAIEAARAGEQGKGFSIVAQEIRSLAEQSKQATTEVRSILNDIQRATSVAVMATEQGSKAVDSGVLQSLKSGEAIKQLADSINEALQVSIQIVASSQQQVVGMNQIGTAMENINQAGTESATSMKQIEMTAQNLNELGQNLKEIVNQYKL